MRMTWAVSAAVVLISGCGARSGEDQEDIKIGVIVSLSGGSGTSGAGPLNAVELALEEINQKGGVLGGRRLRMLLRDDESSSDVARSAAQALVDVEKVSAIIGAITSGVTLSIAEVTIPKQIPLISGSATSPLISDLDDDGFVNRTCPSDALQGRLLAKRAHEKGILRVSTFYADNAYSKGLTGAFTDAFQAMGGQIASSVVAADGKPSYVTELTQLYAPAQAPQAILMPLYSLEAAQVIKDYNTHFQSKNTFWLFADSMAEQAFVDIVGGQGFNFQHEGTGPATPQGASAEAFTQAYRAKYGVDPESTSFAIHFYDAVHLLALSIEAAGETGGAAIRDQLPLVSQGGVAYGPGDFGAAMLAVSAGQDVNYEGASGSVDLDSKGEPIAPYDIWKVQDGQVRVVERSVSP